MLPLLQTNHQVLNDFKCNLLLILLLVVCIGDLNQRNGSITQPVEDSYICSWTRNIRTHLNETIVFSIKASFNKTVRSKPCSHNSFLLITDGNINFNMLKQ